MKWLPVDLVLVSIFAAIGRVSHDEALTPGGWLHTAWPFLAGALLGWVLVRAWGRVPSGLAAGVVIWAACVAGGMALRRLTGEGTALPFVIVALVVLGLLLLGARVLARRRTRAA